MSVGVSWLYWGLGLAQTHTELGSRCGLLYLALTLASPWSVQRFSWQEVEPVNTDVGVFICQVTSSARGQCWWREAWQHGCRRVLCS